MSGEKLQDLNRKLSQAGLPAAVLDDQTRGLSDRIADSTCATDETLERSTSRFEQAYVAWLWEEHVLHFWDNLGEVGGVEIPEETSLLEGREPGLDTLWVVASNTHTMGRTAIAAVHQYRDVAEKMLARIHYCESGVSVGCQGRFADVAAANGLAPSAEYIDSLQLLWGSDDEREAVRAGARYSRIARQLIALRNPTLPYQPRYFRHKRGTYIVVAKVCSVCADLLRNCGPVEDVAPDSFLVAPLNGEISLRRGWYTDLDENGKGIQLPYPETASHRTWTPPWPKNEH